MKRVIGIGMLFLLLAGVIWEQKSLAWFQRQQQKTVQTAAQPEESEEPSRKVAYLTFDDGPSDLTEQYLDILEKEQVNATFFLIGQQIDEEGERTVKRALQSGHEIGIHTYSHKADHIYQTEDVCYEDIMKVKSLLQDKFNYQPKLYRFPWGSANTYVRWYKKDLTSRLLAEGIEYEDWNVSGEDSVGCPSVESILSNVCKDFGKYQEPVILLHDSGCNKSTLQALGEIIRRLKEEGYTFDILSNRSKPCHFGER